MALATVLNPALNYVLIDVTQRGSGNGAVGAAWSLVLTELFVLAGGLVVVGRHVLEASDLWRFLRAGFAALLMAGAMVLTHPHGLVMSGVVGVGVFVAACLGLGVVPRAQLAAGLASVRRARSRRDRTETPEAAR
jgi:hypothetical protein